MKNDIINTIKEFLSQFPYRVMHETGKDNNEYYFCVIEKDDVKKNNILSSYLNAYVNDYTLNKLTDNTMQYIKENNHYYFVFIDSIPKNDKFFKEKENFIKENANNILSKRTIGEIADVDSHLANNTEMCYEKIKKISLNAKKTIVSKITNLKNNKN